MKIKPLLLFATTLLLTGCSIERMRANDELSTHRALNGMMRTNWEMNVNQGQSRTAENNPAGPPP